MQKPDFTLKFIKNAVELERFSNVLVTLPAFALDIETTDWWNRQRERIALLQIAFRAAGKISVVVIDMLAGIDIETLRAPLEHAAATKIMHNAGFDAVRLGTHYNFKVAPVFDTMAAARRSGERKYSLGAQAEIHLGIHLDKSMQGSDWSLRPLSVRQMHYAALDPYATLLLYEHQSVRCLDGGYRLKPPADSVQNRLPLEPLPITTEAAADRLPPSVAEVLPLAELPEVAAALLGIITELPTRYSPGALAAAVTTERVGLAGWIIDRRLGSGAEPDEETVKLAIADLCERELIEITDTRRLAATSAGGRLWQTLK